jgi:hypothetical protein
MDWPIVLNAVRWLAGVCLLALFAWISTMNVSVFWKLYVRKERAPSWIPLLGGLFGVLGLVALPIPGAQRWWWLALLLDPGSVPGLVHTAIWHAIRAFRERNTTE